MSENNDEKEEKNIIDISYREIDSKLLNLSLEKDNEIIIKNIIHIDSE
ncbi:MAG: hypothetical protein IKK80_01520 [Treponema sp.]|nr:hypothetical protein [Treponema sp.]